MTLSGRPEGTLVNALHDVLGNTPLLAYLSVMALRLRELHRVLKPNGTLYLHCDETAGPYLRLVLDCIFGLERFKTEVIWQRTNVHSDSKHWSDVRDGIYCYTKGAVFTWNPCYRPLSDEHVRSKYPHTDPDGRRFSLSDMTSPNPRPNMMYEWLGFPWPAMGWRYEMSTMQRLHEEGRIWYPTLPDGSYDTSKRPRLKRYLEDQPGRVVGNIWTDIPPINSQAAERLGYPTQKPLALLERIISASSNPGDLVLDPFCGCGTAVVAAHRFGRQWCGIDITSLAIKLVRERLCNHFENDFPTPSAVPATGFPRDEHGARDLFDSSRYDFQHWALSLVGARSKGGVRKQGADGGVDGEIFWRDGEGSVKKAIVQVKGGQGVNVGMIRDLSGAMQAEGASLGIFVSLASHTEPMRSFAAGSGLYQLAGTSARPTDYVNEVRARDGWLLPNTVTSFPRIQLYTVAQLLAGQRPAASQDWCKRVAPSGSTCVP